MLPPPTELIADTAPPEEVTEAAAGSAGSAAAAVPPHTEKLSLPDGVRLSRGRGRLILLLVCSVLATVAVIVYGTAIAGGVSRLSSTPAQLLLRQFFPGGYTLSGKPYSPPPLTRIPHKPALEGEEGGAAEEETVSGDAPHFPSDGPLPIREVDLSVKADNVFALINETPFEPDLISLYAEELASPTAEEIRRKYGDSAPMVLILHTHATESFTESGETTYAPDESFRSDDPDRTVVTVGRVAAARLRERGIGVIHIETMFDYEDYNAAYTLAAAEIKRVLAEHPSIAYVFDIHRDAMITAEGACLKPTAPVTWNGGKASQIMLVVGTDHGGAPHGSWESNLSLALKVQKRALALNSGIMRGINLRSASFNAQYCPGSLLVEIGSCGGTLTEACRAAEVFASAVADVIDR